jgi:2-methylisocitrate lyase-like PEP mutase family enzyme
MSSGHTTNPLRRNGGGRLSSTQIDYTQIIFVEAPQSVEEIERIAQAVPAPLLVNMFWGGKTPLVSAARLAELGYRLMIIPSDLQRAAIRAMQRAAAVLRQQGNTAAIADELVSFAERESIVGLPAVEILHKRFSDREG